MSDFSVATQSKEVAGAKAIGGWCRSRLVAISIAGAGGRRHREEAGKAENKMEMEGVVAQALWGGGEAWLRCPISMIAFDNS